MATHPFTRETLLRRLKDQSDEDSWEDFSSCYRPYVFAILKAIGLAHHDCEDLTQDVLLRVWKRMPAFEYDAKKGSFRGWLAMVTRNQAWDKMAREAKRPRLGSELSQQIDIPAEPPAIDAIAKAEWAAFIAKLAWDRVKVGLSDTVRSVFVRLLKGEDPAEIAVACGVERNTVYVYKKRVEQRLNREIRQLDQDLG